MKMHLGGSSGGEALILSFHIPWPGQLQAYDELSLSKILLQRGGAGGSSFLTKSPIGEPSPPLCFMDTRDKGEKGEKVPPTVLYVEVCISGYEDFLAASALRRRRRRPYAIQYQKIDSNHKR
jgi:hypothetical protein